MEKQKAHLFWGFLIRSDVGLLYNGALFRDLEFSIKSKECTLYEPRLEKPCLQGLGENEVERLYYLYRKKKQIP